MIKSNANTGLEIVKNDILKRSHYSFFKLWQNLIDLYERMNGFHVNMGEYVGKIDMYMPFLYTLRKFNIYLILIITTKGPVWAEGES